MASSTTKDVTSLKIHRVPTYDLWKSLYSGGSIGVEDLVIIPPTQLQPALPSQSGNSGKFLTTNGTTISWATVDALPSQSSHSGHFLTTNGSTASWVAIDPLPAQSGKNGYYLTTNGTTASWAQPQATSTKTLDNTPTSGSSNLVSSGGVYAALNGYQPKITANGVLQGNGSGTVTAIGSTGVSLTGIGTPGGVATLNSYGTLMGRQANSKTLILGAGGDLIPYEVDATTYTYNFGGPNSDNPLINYNCCTIIITHLSSLSTFLTISLPTLDNSASGWNGAMNDFEIEFINQSGANIYFFPTDNINGSSVPINFKEQYKSVVFKRIQLSSNVYEWNAQGAIEE